MKRSIQVREFTVVLEPDEEGFHVYCPALKGCHSWGATKAQARKNIAEAIQLWLETAERRGLAMPMLETVKVAA
ncbi:MAG: type II toxin-antitoxin system HicB family antitoxin [Chloroflexi bacterium]|nr:type II toxin-antitoxin system HicB family antitoxin [Chloroflexota bacterium]